MRFSDKQYHAATFGERDGRNIVLCGPIRSGKSASGIRGFLHWAGDNFNGYDFCLAAKSSKQWQSVILNPMREFCGELGITFKARPDHWEIGSRFAGTNRVWRVVAGDGETSSARIEGMTFAGAYLDDVCFHPPVLVNTIADRCSVEGAKIVYTCYPQSPFHPFKLDYIDQLAAGHISGELVTFALADNPSLSGSYIEELKSRYKSQPHEYARRIEGKWAAASGLIYPMFNDHVYTQVPSDVEPTIMQWDVASDWASSSVTHALLIGTASDGTSWVWDEWRWDGREQGTLTTVDQVDRMVPHLTDGGNRSIRNWIIDPSADGLMVALRDKVQGQVMGGVADVDEGLRVTGRWIDGGRVRFRRKGVPALLRELGSYTWHEDRAAEGIDKPDKNSADGAHGADALRYYCHTFQTKMDLAGAGYGVA